MAKLPINAEYRTQKAAGLKALKNSYFPVPPFDVYGVEHFGYESPYDKEIFETSVENQKDRIVQLESLAKTAKGGEQYYLNYALNEAKNFSSVSTPIAKQLGLFPVRSNLDKFVNKFVRPCPMVPRHGFVDSRPVSSVEDAEKLLEETLKVEDKAEFIVMPFIKAAYSAIWTTGRLVIGPGNDGATAGNNSRTIPTLGIAGRNKYDWKSVCTLARITEAPYVEMLWEKPDYSPDYVNMFVQLRNGPNLPDTIDYIPEEIEVTDVILAEGDLLEWEKKAETFTRGTVIYHPGGSLASHYAVHAVLHKTPVLVSREPRVGERLTANTETKTPNISKIRAGFYLGATTDISFENATFAMLVGVHNTSLWLGKHDDLIGFAMGCAYRLTITAALGEYRHAPDKKRKPGRDTVYQHVWNKVLLPVTRTRFMSALDSFLNDSRWPKSFGGKKWYAFGKYAVDMYNSILDENVTKAISHLNSLVHAAHNGGWAFNKFVGEDEMDTCAFSPAVTLFKCAPILYDSIIRLEHESIPDWFKGKHHLELEEVVLEEARREERREKKEAGSNTLYTGKEVKIKESFFNVNSFDEDGNKNKEKYTVDITYTDGKKKTIVCDLQGWLKVSSVKKEDFQTLLKKIVAEKGAKILIDGLQHGKPYNDYCAYLHLGRNNNDTKWTKDGYITVYFADKTISFSKGY